MEYHKASFVIAPYTIEIEDGELVYYDLVPMPAAVQRPSCLHAPSGIPPPPAPTPPPPSPPPPPLSRPTSSEDAIETASDGTLTVGTPSNLGGIYNYSS